MGQIRCVDGRLMRHDPQHDDPDFETDIGQCPHFEMNCGQCECCKTTKITQAEIDEEYAACEEGSF